MNTSLTIELSFIYLNYRAIGPIVPTNEYIILYIYKYIE